MKSNIFRSRCSFLLKRLDDSPARIPELSFAPELKLAGDSELARAERGVDFLKEFLVERSAAGCARLVDQIHRRFLDRLVNRGCFAAAERLEKEWAWVRAARVRHRKGAPSHPASTTLNKIENPSQPAKPVGPAPGTIAESGFTVSQREALSLLHERARLFYAPPPDAATGIPVQTNSLMLGPTGCGKTTLIKCLAAQLGAHPICISHGSWIVHGAQDAHPTTRLLLWAAMHNERVVLFIDELDKFFGSGDGSSWHNSVLNDLWLVLDRGLPWAMFAADGAFVKAVPPEYKSAEAMERLFKTRVFIVGAGTWQQQHRGTPTMGFNSAWVGEVKAENLIRNGGMPEEVLRRFNRDLIHLAYPTIEEIERLIQRDGLLALADKVDEKIEIPELHRQMDTVGMTALTSLKTRLLLKRQRLGNEPNGKIRIVRTVAIV